MAVLHGLPSLTLWHQQSNLRQHTKGCATPVLTIPRCTDGGVLGSMHRPAGRRAPLTIAASAKNCDQPVGTICPSAWDRLLAASMFLWPICEGSWRSVLPVKDRSLAERCLPCSQLLTRRTFLLTAGLQWCLPELFSTMLLTGLSGSTCIVLRSKHQTIRQVLRVVPLTAE